MLCRPHYRLQSLHVRRRHAFIDPAETAIVHLIRAVEDDHVLAQTAAHVLGGLRLAGASRTGRCATERHAKSLCQRDVTSASQQHERSPRVT